MTREILRSRHRVVVYDLRPVYDFFVLYFSSTPIYPDKTVYSSIGYLIYHHFKNVQQLAVVMINHIDYDAGRAYIESQRESLDIFDVSFYAYFKSEELFKDRELTLELDIDNEMLYVYESDYRDIVNYPDDYKDKLCLRLTQGI